MTDQTSDSSFHSDSAEPVDSPIIVYFKANDGISWDNSYLEIETHKKAKQLASACFEMTAEFFDSLRESKAGMLNCRDGEQRLDPEVYDALKTWVKAILGWVFREYSALATALSGKVVQLQPDDDFLGQYLEHVGFDFERATLSDRRHHYSLPPATFRERLTGNGVDEAELNALFGSLQARQLK